MELEALYVDNSLRVHHNREAAYASRIASLIEMGISLHDATDGRITQDLLNNLRHIRNFRIERQKIAQGMQSVGGSGQGFMRVG